MKKLGTRTEVFYSIEFSRNQVISIIAALGLTTPTERRSEAGNHYHVGNFEDDENLLDSLIEVAGLKEEDFGKSLLF